jgi:hypothetical protein
MVSLLSVHCEEGRLLKDVSVFAAVDTSTGVLSNAKMIAETVKEVSPETLVSIRPSSLCHQTSRLLTLMSLATGGPRRCLRGCIRGDPIRRLGHRRCHFSHPKVSSFCPRSSAWAQRQRLMKIVFT